MRRFIERTVAPLKRRIQMMVNKAVLTAVYDDAGQQRVQVNVLNGEIKDEVARLQQYGFTSTPHQGAKALMLCLGGNRDHPVVVVADDARYRKRGLAPGEVAIYTDQGDYIHFKRGGDIVIKAANKVRMETPLLEVTGDIIDRCDDPEGRTMQAMRDTYNSHTHTGDSGGTTSQPGDQM